MIRWYGENEVERRKLLDENKVVEAQCKALRDENSHLKDDKISLEKRLEYLDKELELAVSERTDIKQEFKDMNR